MLNGTVADANEVEANFIPLYIDMAPYNVDVPNKLGTGRFVLESALNDASTPVGSIIPFYDFNGVATFDSTIWKYCDGSVINSPGSILDGQTLPDLSGRYICGFGTDGGGNIDTAPWDVAPVGNAGSTVNLQHHHTVNNHNHSIPNHDHGPGDLEFNVAEKIDDGGQMEFKMRTNNGGAVWSIAKNILASPGAGSSGAQVSSGDNTYTTWGGIGNTDLGGAGNTGNSNPATGDPDWDYNPYDVSLGVVDIRPSTIRVRFIMKIN